MGMPSGKFLEFSNITILMKIKGPFSMSMSIPQNSKLLSGNQKRAMGNQQFTSFSSMIIEKRARF